MASINYLSLLQKYTTPRWMILILDFLLTNFCLFLSYLIRFEFDVPAEEWLILKTSLPYFEILLLIAFYIGKPYAGLMRYTGAIELRRIAFTLLAFIGAVFLVNFTRYFFFEKPYLLPSSILIICFLLSALTLTTLRLTMRLFFINLNKEKTDKVKVLIYGAGEAGFITKRSIEKDGKCPYVVVGFIDTNPKKINLRVEGVPVYAQENLEKLILTKHVKKIIFSVQKPTKENEAFIKKIGLETGVAILKVPPVDSWINGELSTGQIRSLNIDELLGREKIVLENASIKQLINNKTVWVTGAAGSIGSELCRQILSNNPGKLILIDQAESPLYDLQNELLRAGFKNFELIIADVSSRSRMEKAFIHFKPDFIFHAAAYKHVPLMENNPAEAIRVNIKGTKNICDLSIEHGIEQMVLISTDKAVNPTNVMGASKRVAEMYVQSKNGTGKTRFITTRFGNVLGSNGSVIPLFKKQIANGGPLTVTHPDITRYFMTIPEAVSLVLQACILGKGGEIFLFDMGQSVKIDTLAKQMIVLAGLELGKDIEIHYSGLRPGEKLYEELLAQEELTLPTPHQKIMIAKERNHDAITTQNSVQILIDSIDDLSNTHLVAGIKKIVPEYKSQNSEFEALDKL